MPAAKHTGHTAGGHTRDVKVERVRNVAGAATLRPVDPRQPVDRTVTTVVLQVDAPEALRLLGGSANESGATIVGLQVDVEIPL